MGLASGLLQPPPRAIPPMLAAQVALAGPSSQIGWLFFGFGSIFFWMFAWHADLTGWRFQPGAVATVPGAAVGCRDTRYYVGGSRHRRGTPVYENRYRYTVDGSDYDGKSFDTGSCVANGRVTVEYLLSRPAYSRILGMRRGLLSPWALLAALFPAVGLGIAGVGLWNAPLRLRLLRDGLSAPGALTASIPTGARVMGRVVYRVTVDYTPATGPSRSTTFNTNRPERLAGDQPYAVLYDPAAPDRALAIDGLPGEVSLDPAGRILPGNSRAFLFLPAVSLLLNAWFVYRNLH